MERVRFKLEREIHGITWNEQKQLKKSFSIRFMKFESWWETIRIQALQKTIKQQVIHVGYPWMPLASYILE
jgi:hypothetical protein